MVVFIKGWSESDVENFGREGEKEREGGRERESFLIFSCQRRERERERVFVIILKFDLIIY